MRKLASIQRIDAINPIEGADAIEVADVLGWKVVVKKGEFKPDDLAVYFEIDSVPPDLELFRFLWKNTEMRPNNFRIKTVKLRGQISQGILFSWADIFPLIDWDIVHNTEALGYVGDDLTPYLGVGKYEPALPTGSADIAGQFFDGVPKTDEDRVQSRHDLLAELQGRPYYITVKCDGSSMTVAMHDSRAKVASRNYRLADNPDSAYWRAAWRDERGVINLVVDQPWLALQGELVGPGIQNNRLGLTEHRFLVFNVYHRIDGRYLTLDEMQALQCDWGFEMVPLFEKGSEFDYTQSRLLELAEAKYDGTTNEREGIVIRSNDNLPRVSFKAISNRYLLRGGE